MNASAEWSFFVGAFSGPRSCGHPHAQKAAPRFVGDDGLLFTEEAVLYRRHVDYWQSTNFQSLMPFVLGRSVPRAHLLYVLHIRVSVYPPSPLQRQQREPETRRMFR